MTHERLRGHHRVGFTDAGNHNAGLFRSTHSVVDISTRGITIDSAGASPGTPLFADVEVAEGFSVGLTLLAGPVEPSGGQILRTIDVDGAVLLALASGRLRRSDAHRAPVAHLRPCGPADANLLNEVARFVEPSDRRSTAGRARPDLRLAPTWPASRAQEQGTDVGAPLGPHRPTGTCGDARRFDAGRASSRAAGHRR